MKGACVESCRVARNCPNCLTGGGGDITVAVVVSVHDESAGQRQLVRHLDGLPRLPLVDQVVGRPTVWKKKKTRDREREYKLQHIPKFLSRNRRSECRPVQRR